LGFVVCLFVFFLKRSFNFGHMNYSRMIFVSKQFEI